jgi:prolyl oligopeptidase
MVQVIARTGFKGSFEEFLTYLRTDPRFHYDDPQQLLLAYMAMAKRIDPLLPQYFGRLPRIPYGVRPIPAQAAPDTTTAYYQGGGMDGRRAGYYYVNLYKPEQRPKYEIPVLTIHEAVPGHHLQTSLAKELGDLPKFRRDFEATAFVEGWGLYSESLGRGNGPLRGPVRQIRPTHVRDVARGPPRGRYRLARKAMAAAKGHRFFQGECRQVRTRYRHEIDRYIATPGQALAYKIGELRIKELRPRPPRRSGHSSTCAPSMTSCSAAAPSHSTCCRQTCAAGSRRRRQRAAPPPSRIAGRPPADTQ